MALKSSLKRMARQLAEIIWDHGAAQGWSKQELALSIIFEEKTDRFSIVVGSERPIDGRSWYLAIMKAIRSAFPDDPYLPMHIGLVIRKVSSLDDVYRGSSADDDEIDLSDSY